jgi:DNA-binding CsgD family transcriptional regulator
MLRACEPTVRAAINRRWGKVGNRFADAVGAPRDFKLPRAAPVRSIGLTAWRSLGLTEREAAIVDLVLQGHSSDSIAARLTIAAGTVKVHRRNVYRKLAISSQAELLAVYIDRIVGRVAAS